MASLTARQAEILRLVSLGRTSKEIAAELEIGERTVNWHLANIYAKLGVDNRTEAAVLAVEQKLIPPHG